MEKQVSVAVLGVGGGAKLPPAKTGSWLTLDLTGSGVLKKTVVVGVNTS